MKTLLNCICLASCLLLSACATTEKSARATLPATVDGPGQVDTRYVSAVERAARQSGTEVMWVNPPKKPLVATVATSR